MAGIKCSEAVVSLPGVTPGPRVDKHEEDLKKHLAFCGIEQETLGVAIWTTSTVWTTLMGVVVQVADDKGASFVSCVMARCLISTVLVLVGCAVVQMNPMGTNPQLSRLGVGWLLYTAVEKGWEQGKKFLAFQGLMSAGGIVGRVLCYQRLPIAIVNLFTGFMPMFTAWLGVGLLGEYMGWTMIACYIPSILGMVLILQPWNDWGGLDTIGLIELLLFQLSSSLSSFLIRVKAVEKKQEHQLCYNFYAFGMTTVLVLLYMLIFNDVRWVWTTNYDRLWPWYIMIALTGMGTQMAVTTGISLATVTRCTSMRYLAIPLGALADVIFFNNYLNWVQYVGGIMVLASAGVVLWVRDEEETRMMKENDERTRLISEGTPKSAYNLQTADSYPERSEGGATDRTRYTDDVELSTEKSSGKTFRESFKEDVEEGA